MKKIKLPKDKFTLVDDEDFEYLNQYKWLIKSILPNSKAYRIEVDLQNKGRMIFLHREIMKVSDSSIQVIHLNGDNLDNQKSNLRVLAGKEMRAYIKNNLRPKNFDGVAYLRSIEKYIATISKGEMEYRLGAYDTPEEAAMAYDKAGIKLFGYVFLTNKRQGLIEYRQLPDISISFSDFKKVRKKLTSEDKKVFADLTQRINELKEKYKYKKLSELLNISPSELSSISNGKRKISMEKIREILTVIKEKNL